MRNSRDRSDGSALVSAIGLSAVLALVAVFTVRTVLHTATLQTRVLDAAALEREREAAVTLGLLALAEANPPLRYGERTPVATPGGSFEIVWWSPHGRVDLNMAPPIVLIAALEAAGVPDPEAVAGAIIDWRDPDDLVSLGGAERDAYRAAGREGPANRFFRHERELGGVLGLSERWAACLAPYVTVSSWEEAPQPAMAPPALADALAATGRAGETEDLSILAEPGALVGLVLRPGLDMAGEPLSVLIRLTGSAERPYLIQAWDPVEGVRGDCRGGRS